MFEQINVFCWFYILKQLIPQYWALDLNSSDIFDFSVWPVMLNMYSLVHFGFWQGSRTPAVVAEK